MCWFGNLIKLNFNAGIEVAASMLFIYIIVMLCTLCFFNFYGVYFE